MAGIDPHKLAEALASLDGVDTVSALRVLLILAGHDRPVALLEIVEDMGMSLSAVSRLVDKMDSFIEFTWQAQVGPRPRKMLYLSETGRHCMSKVLSTADRKVTLKPVLVGRNFG